MSGEAWHNFMLSEEQEMIRDTAAKFATEVIAKRAIEIDREQIFPTDIFDQLAELGFLGLPISEEMGGAGVGYFGYCLALEEVAKVCGSTALGIEAHISLCTYLIDTFGSLEQRKKYVPALASGKALGAFALTEPGAGSDAGSSKTKAVRDGDVYLISGRKAFQRPMAEGVKLLNLIQDVYLDKTITIA